MSAALLISAATVHAGLDITVYVDTAERNVILPCAAGNYTFADHPRLALADPVCSWHDYTNFLASEGLDWADEPIQLYGIDQSSASTTKMSMQAELTSAMTTALSLADMLRLQLGDEAYASYAEPVTIDVIGWAFHWLDRSQISGTSMTSEAPEWTDELQAAPRTHTHTRTHEHMHMHMHTCTCTCTHAHARAHAHTGRAERVQEATRVFWGAQIGAALRRMLPLVPRFLVRGFGPEAPQLAPTKLDEDGWLVLELFPGLYEAPSEPPPTLTLLENSGLHDDYWPSDGGCVSFNGRHLSEAALRARKAAGELEGVGLGCLWRETVELLRETGRPVFATSYQSHEHLSALENLLAIGARITHAYPNGFREASTRVPTTDLLEPPGPVAEAMRDSYPRPWGAKEAQLATTAALWRFKVEKGGYERSVCGRRNSHVIGFQGCAPPGCDPPAREATAERDGAYAAMWRHANSAREVQRALQSRLCAASELASMPPRQAEIVRATWRCAAPAKLDWARLGEPVPAAEPKAEVQALLERAVELSAEESEGAAEATEEAFRAAAEADPDDARPPLNLGRFLAKLSRPAEAIEQVCLLCRPLPPHTPPPPPPPRTRAVQGVPHPNPHPSPRPRPRPRP